MVSAAVLPSKKTSVPASGVLLAVHGKSAVLGEVRGAVGGDGVPAVALAARPVGGTIDEGTEERGGQPVVAFLFEVDEIGRDPFGAVVRRGGAVAIDEGDVVAGEGVVVNHAGQEGIVIGVRQDGGGPGVVPAIGQVGDDDVNAGPQGRQPAEDGVGAVEGAADFALAVGVVVAADVEGDVVRVDPVAGREPAAAVVFLGAGIRDQVDEDVAGGVTAVALVVRLAGPGEDVVNPSRRAGRPGGLRCRRSWA